MKKPWFSPGLYWLAKCRFCSILVLFVTTGLAGLLSPWSTAAAACSTHVGKVVFNEINSPASGTSFLELKVIDSSVLTATSNLSGWKIGVFRTDEKKNKGKSEYTTTSSTADLGSIFSSSAINTCGVSSPWIKVPDSSIGNVVAGLNNNNPQVVNLNLVLYEESSGAKRIVDIVRLGPSSTNPRTIYSGYDSCSTIESGLPTSTGTVSNYDAIKSASGSSEKNWFRTPDGTGTWSGTENANDKNTACSSNDGSTSSSPAAFAAYETSVSDASALTATSRLITTRVASASGSLCTIEGICALTVASFSASAIETSYSGTVTAALEYCANISRSGSVVSCGGTWTAISGASQSVTLSGGKGTVTFGAVTNAYEMVRVKISSATVSGGPWLPSATTSYFAIRPASLTVTATDATSSAAGTTHSLNSGTGAHKAGQPFTLNAQATTTGGGVASNYRGTGNGPVVKTVTTTTPSVAAGGVSGILTLGTWSGSGTVSSSSATYSETGSVDVTLEDQDYANVDSGDSTTLERYFSGSASLGRFIPDHFTVTSPVFTPGCGTFTYMGQAFVFSATLEAQNLANTITRNFTDVFAGATVAPELENNNSGVAIDTARLTGLGSPSWLSGTYAFVATSFSRDTSPDGVYDQLDIGLRVDAETSLAASERPYLVSRNMTAANSTCTADMPGLSNGNCTAVRIANNARVRFGRLRLSSAYGSDKASLAVPVQAQYWGGLTWVKNTEDSCTIIPKNAVRLSGALSANNVVEANVAINNGAADLLLKCPYSTCPPTSTPAPALVGAVGVCLDLGTDPVAGIVCSTASPAALSYLQGKWPPGANYANDPAATASFGVYAPETRKLIHVRELY